MKIARVVLTATILFSLKSTLFCSDKQTEETIQITRKNSGVHHDGTRDGLFGSGLDTLKNIKDKKSYGSQPYGMGSDSGAISRWTPIIKTIKDLDLAHVVASEAKRLESFGLIFSEEALKPSQDLIDTENQKLEAIKQALYMEAHASNIAAITLLQQFYLTKEANVLKDAALLEQHNARIEAAKKESEELLKSEQEALRIQRKQERTALVATLQEKFEQIKTLNPNFSNKNIFVLSKDSLQEKNLCKLATRYQDGKEKNRTFAEITQGK